ncbi:MAG: hypothetical protein WAU65_01860 [Candidatus Nanoarchaeia archaeon]
MMLQHANFGKMKTKKGQLKIQQMTFMLIAVTLFFVLAGMFVLVTSVNGLKQKASVLQQDNAQLLVSKISDSPEFSCGDSFSNYFGTGMSSCIDVDKVISLENNLKIYGNGTFWGVQGIQIRTVYPQTDNVECTISNFPNCNKITLIPTNNGTGTSNIVSLCGYSINGSIECNLAKIIVTYQGT